MNKQELAERMWQILSEDIPSDRVVVMEAEVLPALLEAISDAESSAEALKNRIADLNTRKMRFDRQAESLRDLLRTWMEHTGEYRLTLPTATVSLVAGKPTLRVVNIDELPDEYVKIEKTANKAALRDAAKNQKHVPGTVSNNTTPSIRIRRN